MARIATLATVVGKFFWWAPCALPAAVLIGARIFAASAALNLPIAVGLGGEGTIIRELAQVGRQRFKAFLRLDTCGPSGVRRRGSDDAEARHL